ncbi:MAG TPA: hypothetical protein VE377_05825 [Candidatus Dormibacteraeota bacterium]|nr:hypothetical protein [Candidatus Dormibacteraeota bacterium]
MSHDPNPAKNGHGDYERSDIGTRGIVYFLLGLAVALVVTYFVVDGIYRYLNHRFEAEQPAVSPLVTSAQQDTRRIPPQYKDNEYEKYLKEGFPSPQLEVNERTELNDERLREEQTLSTYDYVDKNAGTVRIPIDRAMELVAQRGLPTRQATGDQPKAQPQQTRGKK